MMRVTRFNAERAQFLVISHQEITERKVAEQQIEKLARTDELTGLANRRRFEGCLRNQWKRGARTRTPLSLAFIDIDHFKMIPTVTVSEINVLSFCHLVFPNLQSAQRISVPDTVATSL